jgi:hypothetical protein
MDEFNKVNASIKRSNDSFKVSQMEPIPAPGSLGALLDSTTDLLDRTTAALESRDPGGENTKIAKKLLIHTKLGDSIRVAVLTIYDKCRDAVTSPDKKTQVDSAFAISRRFIDSARWYGPLFDGTPTSIALIVLNHLEGSCQRGVELARLEPRP